MMQSRNEARRRQDEPKVIAISATRPQVSSALLWAAGAAFAACAWLTLLLH